MTPDQGFTDNPGSREPVELIAAWPLFHTSRAEAETCPACIVVCPAPVDQHEKGGRGARNPFESGGRP